MHQEGSMELNFWPAKCWLHILQSCKLLELSATLQRRCRRRDACSFCYECCRARSTSHQPLAHPNSQRALFSYGTSRLKERVEVLLPARGTGEALP